MISEPTEYSKYPINDITENKIKQVEVNNQFEEFDQIFKEEIIEEEPVERKPLSEFNLKYERDDFDEEEKHPVNQVIKVKAENYISEDLLPDIVKYETEAVKTELEIDISYEDVKTDIGGDLNENEFDSKECTIIKSDESPAGNRSPELETGTEILLHKTEDSAERTVKIEKATENSRSSTLTSEQPFSPKDSEEKPFKCQSCSKSFSLKRYLRNHENTHDITPVQCEVCLKWICSKKYLKRHKQTHSSEKQFQCEFCSKSFSSSRYLKAHRNIHTCEKSFQCKYCSQSFTQSVYLTVHERTHTGEKPYQCKYCSKSFSQKGSQNVHEKTHRGEKTHHCSYCSRSFVTKTTLNCHLRVHKRNRLKEQEKIDSGKNLHQCKSCGKSFYQKRHLYKHEKIHVEEKPHQCNHCLNVFLTKYHLNRHMKVHTNDHEKIDTDSSEFFTFL